ncbi:hypothetical protein NBRC111894_3272 [Sporolactobacillus inulinus]|uniref:Uncharacterized protein n=1 Tax=Sporolactobacillus inulinus TaxID=2078 RepID=A0A4Y1ZGX3_9BACL|nr:hypothetical protein NBRC111894_3272 [Sporolactobacillus inulinus]
MLCKKGKRITVIKATFLLISSASIIHYHSFLTVQDHGRKFKSSWMNIPRFANDFTM